MKTSVAVTNDDMTTTGRPCNASRLVWEFKCGVIVCWKMKEVNGACVVYSGETTKSCACWLLLLVAVIVVVISWTAMTSNGD